MKFFKQHEKVMIALGVAIAAYIVYTIYQAIAKGVTDLASLAMAPFTAIANEAAAVTASITGTTSAISQAAAANAAGNAAAAQITTLNNNQYAPGGTIYNQIAATQGTAAANAAYQTEQQNQAVQASQTVTANPLTWF